MLALRFDARRGAALVYLTNAKYLHWRSSETPNTGKAPLSTPRHVLWTSGWDSTYRVCTLLLEDRAQIQPWYVRDHMRPSTGVELRHMALIRAALTAKAPWVRDLMRPVRILDRRSLMVSDEVRAAFQQLRRESFLGSQWEWLPAVPKAAGVPLEVSAHKDDNSYAFVRPSATWDPREKVFVLVPDSRFAVLFQDFRFPILEVTKTEMLKRAEELGFADVMFMTWFCHTPLLGAPCGVCGPCRYTREEGLAHRVPPPTFPRKAAHKAINLWYKAVGGSLAGVIRRSSTDL